MREILCLILGGGRGARLFPLTKLRSKPAVPIAGKYRLIDIPISNCLNSDLNRVYVLTQFLSVSLHRHIANTYKFDPFSKGFVEVLAAQQTIEAADWYQGTADAVRQNLRTIQEDPCQEVLILSGDQLYRMDFRHLLKTHRDTQADITIAVLPVSRDQIGALGLVQVNSEGQVIGFAEKPQSESPVAKFPVSEDWLQKRGIDPRGRKYLASMGIYLFKKDALLELLAEQPPAVDFGKDIFPRSLRGHQVQTFLFDGYWEDVGTVKSYHEANLALAGDNPAFDFHSSEGVIYTRMRYLPASRIGGAKLDHALVSDGCVVDSGTLIERSVVGVRSRIGKNVTLRNTVVIGADRFENENERSNNRKNGIPDLGIGDESVVEGAIVDKDCRIGRGVRITNRRQVQTEDGENYVIRDGIVVIPKGLAIPDGTIL